MPLFRMNGRKVVRILPQERRIKEDVIHRLIEDNLTNFLVTCSSWHVSLV
jgi:hypothetical protein